MPDKPKPIVTNTDPPLVRDPIPAEQVAGLSEDDQRSAEARSLQTMHSALGHQADALDGEHGRKLEQNGYVSRQELERLLEEHERQMRGMMAVFEMFQKNDPRRGALSTAEDLARDKAIQEANVAELTSAPRQPVYIAPEPYEAEAMRAHEGQPLFRVIQLNSVTTLIPVGQVVNVPWQIADLLRHAQEGRGGQWRKQQVGGTALRFDNLSYQVPGAAIVAHEGEPAQDLETIPRPEQRPWADSVGRSGVVGQGVFRPFTSGPRVELDAR